jgi:hypothetical protein
VKDVTGALASLGGKEEPPFDISEFEVEHFVGALWGCTLAWDPRTAQVRVCVLCAYDPGSTRAGMLVGGSTGRLRQVRVSGGNETLGSRREGVELQGTKYAMHTRASELQTRQDSRRERRLIPHPSPAQSRYDTNTYGTSLTASHASAIDELHLQLDACAISRPSRRLSPFSPPPLNSPLPRSCSTSTRRVLALVVRRGDRRKLLESGRLSSVRDPLPQSTLTDDCETVVDSSLHPGELILT